VQYSSKIKQGNQINTPKNIYQTQNSGKTYKNVRLSQVNNQNLQNQIGNSSFLSQIKKKTDNQDLNRNSYQEILKHESNNIFQSFNSENKNKTQNINRISYWNKALLIQDEKINYANNDTQILNTQLDLQNQIVIFQDTIRTRCTLLNQNLQKKLELFLTFYCKNEDIDFNSLQCFFSAFTLLLKYHDPNLHNILSKNDIVPEIYAYPWFITLFARCLIITLSIIKFENLKYQRTKRNIQSQFQKEWKFIYI
ncbi:TBC domain protein, partial [Ichthyophthirius multifiliis]